MSLLVTAEQLQERCAIARGELAPLADGMRRELAPLVDAPPPVPREKALLSRQGGRCTIDGALLRFDPWDPRHRCPECGREYAGGLHDRFRLYWYQLWLAERVVHSALLGVVLDDERCRNAAVTLLDRYAEQYLRYPNADNVLGPSRPFFSTYLESIWLLQLTIALDILETAAPSPELTSLGSRVRDRLIAPSAQLIASFDEGMSNRQVWNNAALLASARMLDDRVLFDRALRGRSGLHAHLTSALLSDGSWYEGENYHFFAHRGLWYGARIASTAGQPLTGSLDTRFHEGFAAPFRTVLPDLTFPSRRDSQYAVSLRQPRFAESCELGLADRDDERLAGILARLYDPSIPRRDTGRAASSGDVERNLPATGLTRADLSWRTLLCARRQLPRLIGQPLHSDLLPAQGLGVIRRENGALYVSLDYGHSGGGHGHPDRLNLTLVDGARRWFDDPGTGSYVDPTLHWYRSTLAHNAPLVDRRSQPRVHGELFAFSDNDKSGWVSARAELAPGLIVHRTVIAMTDYIVDELRWDGTSAHEIDLPMHSVDVAADALREPGVLEGGTGDEDGFAFLADTARVELPENGPAILTGTSADGGTLMGWALADPDAEPELWTMTTPNAPGRDGRLPAVLLRQRGLVGRTVSVWSWTRSIKTVEREGDVLVVHCDDGSRHRHRAAGQGWMVEVVRDEQARLLELGGKVGRLSGPVVVAPEYRTTPTRGAPVPVLHTLPSLFELGDAHYRRSEFTWQGAGGPVAFVAVTRPTLGTVHVEIEVPNSQRLFVSPVMENQLDNEPASINGDSVQLYAINGLRSAGLLLVPDVTGVLVRPVDGWTNDLAVDAKWRPTSSGYHLEATLHIDGRTPEFSLDVLINEVVSGRARRRGQLVMSGANEEFVYLRGDRHDPSRLLRFTLANV
ncbi:MAG: heparinase II/III family protein [Gemmatimonadaceae bacterium]